MGITDYGAKALTLGETERNELLMDLYLGERNISRHTAGVCYDAVAFCWALSGWLAPERLLSMGGQNLLGDFDFDSGMKWDGEEIPLGSAVGFKRTRDDPGYFHAMIAVGGTRVRGTNSYVSTPDWTEPFDLLALEKRNGTYELDGQPIEVWYVWCA